MGLFTVVGSLGLWGCREARRAAARPTGPGAHVRRGGGGRRPTSRGYRVGRGGVVEWAGRLGCPASRRDVPSHSGRRGRPARHQLRARKDGRSPALLQGAQNGGRGGPGERAGESPTQRKRAFPSSAAASCDPTVYRAPSWHLRSSSTPWKQAAFRGGRGFSAVALTPRSVGGDESWASLALVVILLGICPLRVWVVAYSQASGTVV